MNRPAFARHALGDIAEITSGLSLAGAVLHQPTGKYQIIQPRHIDGAGRPFVFDSAIHSTRMDLPDRADGYLVRSGDVLFMSRGEKNRAAVIRSCPPATIAPAAFFVLRARVDLVLPDFLAWYLNQVPAQAAIAQIRTSAGTPMVQRANFSALCIALPSLTKQREIIRLGELMLREQQLTGQVATIVAERNRLIGQTVSNSLSSGKIHDHV